MTNQFSRRTLLLAAGAASSTAMPFLASAVLPKDTPVTPLPNPANFRNGDFIWPKKPGAYIPYAGNGQDTFAEDRGRWLKERDNYIASLRRKPEVTLDEQQQISELGNMEFREFIALYEGDQQPGVPDLYAGGSFYVGHVGIVEIDNGVPYVVEALLHHGVIRHTYAHWLETRPGEIVWHGRVSNLTPEQGGVVVEVAKTQIGKPYEFWNFDLNDDSGFYCSKLAWMSLYRATKQAIDGKAKSKRHFWFSPKQLLYASKMIRLHDPGKYATA